MIGKFIRVGVGILRTVLADTGAVIAQIGDAASNQVEADGAAWWQQIGLLSRPSKADAGKQSAEGVVVRLHGHDAVIASRDLRGIDLAGNIREGETCLYGGGADGTAQGRVMIKQNGSIVMFTTSDNTADGEAVYFRVSPTAFEFVAPWGVMKFDSSGFHVNHASGSRFDLGGIAGMPAPLDQISSYVRVQAGSFVANATCQSLGADVGGQPLASATAIKSAIAILQGEIAALQFAIAKIVMVPPVSADTTAVAAASSAATTVSASTLTTLPAAVALVDTNTTST